LRRRASRPQLKRDPLGCAYLRTFCITLVVAGIAACRAPRSERDQILVSAVIIDEIRDLTDKATPGEYVGLGVMDADSAQTIKENHWIVTWYTVQRNHVQLPEELRLRFARHFDVGNPPPDPYQLDNTYYLRRVEPSGDTLLIADIGPSYAPCTYTFKRTRGNWLLQRDRTTNCRII